MIDLCELLFARGLPKNKSVKLVRHFSSEWDLWALASRGQIDLYQSNQGKPRFKDCEYVVSFLGEKHSLARFIGVYRVKGVVEADRRVWPPEFFYQEMQPGHYWYDLEKLSGFEDLEKRAVIKWVGRIWHQWLTPREVMEILPTGYVKEFPGYDEVLLTHTELCQIIRHPTSNREWHRALSSIAGIYLITELNSGQQYVGSAYGADGLLGRWRSYAQTGHGDNRQLRELLQRKPSAVRDFQFSILRAMPISLTKDEVLESERVYKRKLGSRAHGLNSN
jgi:hypothetical protein